VPRHTKSAVGALTLLALTACSGEGGANDTATSQGDPDACPVEVVDVVVSVSQWGGLVTQLGGDCANVTTIVSSGSVDPHDFEPGTADLAAFSGADLVVVNGGHYDEWAADAVATLDPEPRVVSAAEVAGVGEDEDPHLWVDPAVVPEMVTALAAGLADVAGDEDGWFDQQAAAWAGEARDYLDAVAELTAIAPGHTYVATEGVFDRLTAAVGLTDVTPEGYKRAASNESEPAPGELAAFETALTDGTADVLIYNTQTSGSVPERLRDAAEQAGVPVVEVTESPVDATGSFDAWQYAQVTALSDALSSIP
jgi:zinc/manganese transport system substrate-binding protein